MQRFVVSRARDCVRVVRTFSLARPKVFGRLVMIGLLVPYVVWLAFGYRYHFIDGLNLLVHEAGHLLLMPFGQTWHMLGGTLLQIAMPVAFCVHFMRRGNRFAAGVVGVWLSESLMNTGRYMGDAVARQLPLFGGHLHDWNWLLGKADLLRHAEALGFFVHVFAASLAFGALFFAWQHRDYVVPVVGLVAEALGETDSTSAQGTSDTVAQPIARALGEAWPMVNEEDDVPLAPHHGSRKRVLV